MTEKQLKKIEYRWTDNFYDCEDLKQVFAEVRRLREALKRYGHHESGPDGCRFSPCTCGLDNEIGGGATRPR